ncbi:glycosyltransferase family 39 protein [Mycobacterium sp. 1274761.0]|uniref:glycosyltransferase family 39 protein n=1 Tax=Mycobacterium sp. 1274761.0 TaxID=1834077 RepID=UPI0007FD0D7E|nr:glycosyltransferase family 39 protein [Mycobacterium sp. 1274761.0]OBK76017.1 glycosyl transferase [Mycobacterium sp. 1274761.0]
MQATRRQSRCVSVCSRVAFGALLVGTAVLYLWNLSASGWANSFYSAAAQAGASNWTAMLFGSSDAANAITVDKTPASLWIIDLSVRIFGLSPWSVLAPQALEGVAAVALLYAAVRRVSGPGAALLAGVVLALTPAAALMFRFNNPDALLVLALVAGVYCTQRACEKDASRWWLVAAGAAVGLGFLAKMLQAFLVLPGFVAAYVATGSRSVRRRLVDMTALVAAMVLSGGWYLLLVELWPSQSRPYIGGSQHNSIVELALGYNGIGRLTGDEPGGLGNLNFDVGWARLFGHSMGGHIAWLMPAALICLGAIIVITRRVPRTDPVRAATLIWGGWLLVTAVVFSFMNGIVHPYYTVALAPAVAAMVGIGAMLLWQNRSELPAATALAGAVVVTSVLACVLLARSDGWLPWLRAVIAVGGVAAAVLLLVAGRLNATPARAVACLGVLACLAGPAAYSVATAASPHVGAIPSVGPAGHGSGPPGGLLNAPTPGPRLTSTLAADAGQFTWAAAALGSNNAAGYQLASGVPVMAVGGFNGTDPSPTLREFQRLVADKKIHYFIGGRVMFGRWGSSGSGEAETIADWVETHFSPTTVDRAVIYDLTQPPKNS